MKWFTLFLELVLLVVMPTPKNIRKLFALINGAIAGPDEGPAKFTPNQWDEMRKQRDKK